VQRGISDEAFVGGGTTHVAIAQGPASLTSRLLSAIRGADTTRDISRAAELRTQKTPQRARHDRQRARS
jgi:hypothetical protein